jgi:hypothetical protein
MVDQLKQFKGDKLKFDLTLYGRADKPIFLPTDTVEKGNKQNPWRKTSAAIIEIYRHWWCWQC